jgi:hypothetical protein
MVAGELSGLPCRLGCCTILREPHTTHPLLHPSQFRSQKEIVHQNVTAFGVRGIGPVTRSGVLYTVHTTAMAVQAEVVKASEPFRHYPEGPGSFILLSVRGLLEFCADETQNLHAKILRMDLPIICKTTACRVVERVGPCSVAALTRSVLSDVRTGRAGRTC